MIRSGIRRTFRLAIRGKSRWERDVEEEVRLHLAFRAEQFMARGMAPDDAYREAVARFGPLDESRARLIEAARHREQRMQRTEYLVDLWQDIGFARRTIGHQKGWTAVTVFTFALGIAASTAVFSVVSRLLLHAVDYPHADRVVEISQQPSTGNNTGMRVAVAPRARTYRAWRDQAHELDGLVAYQEGPVSMKTDGDAVTLDAARVVPELFHFTGHPVIAGRAITTQDIVEGGRVVVIAESFWRQRLGGDLAAMGKRITLDDSIYTIIGVASGAMSLPGAGRSPTQLWLPLDARNDKLAFALVGRLRAGASITAAATELDTIYGRSEELTGGPLPFTAVVYRPNSDLSFHDSLIALSAAVCLVLLIACANVAHLLIARGAARARELAIRAALGAGRGRLFRQLLTESLILASAGAAFGVALGWVALRTMVALRPASLHALDAARLDATTLGAALVVTVVSGLAFGVIGALQSRRQSTHDALKAGAVGRAPAIRARVRGLMIVTEMALSATLLVGATMLVRSVIHMQRADLGFDPMHLYQFDNPFPSHGYGGREAAPARSAFLAALLDRLRHDGGVRAATVATNGVGFREFDIGRFEVEGEAAPPATKTSFIDVNQVAANYFSAMGIALVRGSGFTDTSATTAQVIVNRRFAEAHWPHSDALGHRLRIAHDGKEPWLTIVGVANDASTGGVGSFQSTEPLLYTPLSDNSRVSVLVRTSGDTASPSRIRKSVAVASGRPVPTVVVEQQMAAALSGPRYVMLLLALLTLLALVLSAVGLYGVMAFVVTQQTREIGIRLALGATRQRVARAVLSRGVALAVVGAAIGLAAAHWGTQLIEHELYGVTRSDPASFAVGAAVLIAAALLACIVPTRRALAVDPMTAIRAD